MVRIYRDGSQSLRSNFQSNAGTKLKFGNLGGKAPANPQKLRKFFVKVYVKLFAYRKVYGHNNFNLRYLLAALCKQFVTR